MIWNWKRSWDRPLFTFLRRHYCPKCSTQLKTIKITKIIDSKSSEAKNYDLSFPSGFGFLFGKIKLIWTEFECPKCGNQIKIDEMYKIEKEQERRDSN